MPVEITWEERGVRFTLWGVVTSMEAFAANEAFFGDERCERVDFQIVDATSAEALEMKAFDLDYVAALGAGGRTYTKNLRVALVSEDPMITEKFLRYVFTSEKINQDWTFKVFDDSDEARRWAEQPPKRK